MDKYVIRGGSQVFGTVEASGNKNAALPCIAASLLADGPVTLRRVPEIEDVSVMLELVTSLGSRVEHLDTGTYRITKQGVSSSIHKQYADAIRASILLVPPILHHNRSVELPPPGGDVIGHRRLDTHFLVFESFGAEASILDNGNIAIRADQLTSADIFLDETSVTATENAVMLAAVNEGTTVIRNAASEPHVQELCGMLAAMGAEISGIGSNLITITGKRRLKGCDATIGSDYMEVGSYIGLAACTGGSITIRNTDPQHIRVLRNSFVRLGIDWSLRGNNLKVSCSRQRTVSPGIAGHTPKIDDAPWPGFPTDLLSILTVAATQTEGTVLIHEKMFESRLFFIDTLIRMGANIILCDPHRAVVTGPSRLHGQVMSSPDVRAGMALVIAALSAHGISEIQNAYQIDRGYECLCEKLQRIGADIQRG